MSDSDLPAVLIVDDEPSILEVFEHWLEDDYEVYTALGGEDAMALLETEDIDVVLLDRRMPGFSGDEVLKLIKELGHECQVAMVTAVEPNLDIIEMGFDAYIVKPPTYDGLKATIENLLDRREYPGHRREYWSLLSKRFVLEEQLTRTELENSEEYHALLDRIEALETLLGQAKERMAEDTDFISTIRDIERGN